MKKLINFIATPVTMLLITHMAFAQYHSQFHQDQFVNEHYFNNKTHGVFVDIGAYDGVTISNSLFFEKELGWSGICIEPMPNVFDQLKKNRSCICLNCCVSSSNGMVNFSKLHSPKVSVADMLSGIQTKELLDDLNNFIRHHEGAIETIQVPSKRLNDILIENNITTIDFLSIDTEGAELDIVQSIDFDKFKIHVMTIENNHHDPRLSAFLTSKGFTRATTLEIDEVYHNVNLMY